MGVENPNRRQLFRGLATTPLLLLQTHSSSAQSSRQFAFASGKVMFETMRQNGADAVLFPPGSILSSPSEGYQWQVLQADDDSADLVVNGARLAVLPKDGAFELEAFGVDGSASKDDFEGWQAALRAAIRSGLKLLGQPSKVYDFDPFQNTTVTATPKTGEFLWLDLRGATLRFANNLKPPPKTKFFVHQIAVMVRKQTGVVNGNPRFVRIENFVTDGNLRGQNDLRIGTVVAEQMAHIKFMCFAGDGNLLDLLEIKNFRSVDPVADCLYIGPSEKVQNLRGDAGIRRVVIQNGHAGVRRSVRAFIAIGSSVNRADITGITCDELTTLEGNSIETEFSSIGSQKVEINIEDCVIDDLEFGGKKNLEDQLVVHVRRSIARRFSLFVYCNVQASECVFGIALPNSWRVRKGQFTNTSFRHSVAKDKRGKTDIQPLVFASVTEGTHEILMERCNHVIDGVAPDNMEQAFIRFGNDSHVNLGQKIARIVMSRFDVRGAASINNLAGWLIETESCRFSGTKFGVRTGQFDSGSYRFAGAWRSRNDDFMNVTGTPIEILSAQSNGGWLELTGGKWPSLNYRCQGRACDSILLRSSRVLTVEAFPEFPAGLRGDIIALSENAKAKQVAGAPVMWQCFQSGEGGTRHAAAQYSAVAG